MTDSRQSPPERPARIGRAGSAAPLPWLATAVSAAVLTVLAADVYARTSGLSVDADRFFLGTYPWPWTAPGFWAYGLAPLTTVAVIGAFLAPGLALTRWRAGGDVFRWMVRGFAVSVLISVVLTLFLAMSGSALGEGGLGVMLIGIGGLSFLIGRTRLGGAALREERPADPLRDEAACPFLWTAGGVVFLLSAVMAPKLHWEHLNGDGAHAYESIRLLLQQASPFWPPEAGSISGFPGVTSFLFSPPGAVFVRLLGPLEAAARAPAFLYLVPVVAGLLGLARVAGARVDRFTIRTTWLGGVLYLLVIGYSATYNPYTADLALPATQDTLLMATFLGFVMAFVNHAPGWMALFALLTYVGLPSGGLLLALWCAATVLVFRPLPWRRLAWAVAAVAGVAVIGALIPVLSDLLGSPAPGDEYAGQSLVDRLRDPVIRDFRRILYWVVPAGIVPAASLVAVRGQPPIGRAMAIVVLVYFAFFYVQSKTALHYYVPAMLLPWIVLWSHERSPSGDKRIRRLVLLGLVAAFALSWPVGYRLDRTAYVVGAAIHEGVGDYASSDPTVFAASDLLREVLPLDWDPDVPQESYGGSPLVWLRYASRGAGGEGAALVLLGASDAAPEGARVLSSSPDATLYVRDVAAWRSLRDLQPPTLAGAPLYRIPKWALY